MLNFDPHGKFARRLKGSLIYLALAFVALGIAAYFLKGWRDSQGSDASVLTQIRMKAIQAALGSRHFFRGKYPTTEEGGLKTMFNPTIQGKAIRYPVVFVDFEKNPGNLDGWKQEFQYLCPGVHNKDSYDLWSVGEDGKDGTKDDITNW